MKNYETLAQIQADLKAGLVDCTTLVDGYLANIEQHAHLNAFHQVHAEEAKIRAKEVQQKFEQGQAGRLAGMVISLKDVFCHDGKTLTAGSKILDGFHSQFNATPVQRLLDEDAIIIGRNNCDEFAMGSSSENCAYGAVINAAGENRVPGGSSGGSAVAVQANMSLASIGSDTGGSIRQPASYCGVVGLKPTYGRVSRHGLASYASSLDVVGPLTKSVEDAALLLEIMAGSDDFDDTVSQQPVPEYSKFEPWDGMARIASFDDYIQHDGLAASVKSSLTTLFGDLQQDGHSVDMRQFHLLNYVLPVYYILTTAEASTNLSRYDGVKYGYRSKNANDLMSMYKKSRSEGFGPEVIKRILLGTFVLSEGYHDAYFTKAQKVRRLIKQETIALFEDHDFIIVPTAPTTAFPLHSHDRDPLEMYLEDIFTVQASLAGLPAISLPNGVDEDGMPIGVQVIANKFEEEKLLSFSKYLMDNYLNKQA